MTTPGDVSLTGIVRATSRIGLTYGNGSDCQKQNWAPLISAETVRSKIGLTVTVKRKTGFTSSKGTDSQSKLVLLVVRVVTSPSKSGFTCSKGSDCPGENWS